jgi:hypothetical protein
MTKEEVIFMRDYDIKSMEFYCANDECYEAKFVTNNDEMFEFKASKHVVMEHIKKHSTHLEKYLTNKNLVVAHFHAMARAWYRATHIPKDDVEVLYKDKTHFEEA